MEVDSRQERFAKAVTTTGAVVALLALYGVIGYAIVWVLHALWRAT